VFDAGFAAADLTPRGKSRGCDINGFIARKQPALGVKKPVKGRVLALQAGRFRAIVAVCDLLGFSLKDSLRIETSMGRAAGTPAGNVLLACTHTHSGPVSMPLGTVGRFRPAYVARIKRDLTRAARQAVRDMTPVVDVRLGGGDASDLGGFRCATSEPGRDRWPGRFTVLALERRGADPIIVLHLGVHPYVLGPRNRYVHPDYPGDTCDELERRAGGRALFVPGCGADIHPIPPGTNSTAAVRRFGRSLASRTLKALDTAQGIDLSPARSAVASPLIRYGFLPPQPRTQSKEGAVRMLQTKDDRVARNLREWTEGLRTGACPRALRFRTHILRLGQLMLIGMPAELFYDTGEDLSRALPGVRVLTVSQAGGDVGYLPRPFAYKHRTYEASSAHQWYRTAGAAVRGTEAAVRRAVAARARRLLA